MKYNIINFPVADSTNNIAKQLATGNAPEWTVITADTQTAGRGRLGRSFCSPESTGLYMSVILRLDIKAEDAVLITAAAAVAAANAIDHVAGGRSGIKWVNDIYRDGKKVSGILTEGKLDLETDKLDYAVLGIGVNIEDPEAGFPNEIANIAGSLFKHGEAPENIKSRLLALILDNFAGIYYELTEKKFIEEYRERSILKNADVNVIKPDKTVPARVIDIDDNCGLVVRYDDGRTEALTTGDVSIRIR